MAALSNCSHSVQTVVSIWTASQNKRLEKDKVKRGIEPSLDRETTLSFSVQNEEVEIHPFISHSDLVVRSHKVLSDSSCRGIRSGPEPRHQTTESEELSDRRLSVAYPAQVDKAGESVSEMHKMEMELVDELLGHVLDLENRARKLLINAFDHGSKPRLLLQADKNLMERAQQILSPSHGYDEEERPPVDRGGDDSRSDLEEIQ